MEEVKNYNSNIATQLENINGYLIPEEDKQLLIELFNSIHDISSFNPLTREKGQNKFQETFDKVFDNQSLQECIKQVFATAQNQLSQSAWQEQMSGLFVLRIEVQRYNCTHERYQEIYNLAQKYLDNQENRIREITSDILAYIGTNDRECFKQLKQFIYNHLNVTFEEINLPQIHQIGSESMNIGEEQKDASHDQQQYKETETCQWQTKNSVFIESYIQCLKKTLLQISQQQKDEKDNLIDPDIMSVTSKASYHIHKHIREAAVGLAQVFTLLLSSEEFKENANEISNIIGRGLSDSFTQVRHQGVKAIKDFFKKCDECHIKDLFIPKLIYRFCFNIHHPAEGLKSFTRMSWMEVFPVGGRDLVAKNASETTKNHEIRQAACICLQEMISKVIKFNRRKYNFYQIIFKTTLLFDQIKIQYHKYLEFLIRAVDFHILNDIQIQVMSTTEESKQAVISLKQDILEALLNCCQFEPNSLAREESLKCLAKLLEEMGDLMNNEERGQLREIALFRMPDQCNQVKQNAAMVLGVLFKQNKDEEQKTAFIQEVKDKLSNVSKVEVQPQSLVQGSDLANPSPQYIQNAKNRFIIEHFEGLVALVKELGYAVGKDKSQITQELSQLITNNMRTLCFEKNENIKENIWAMYSEILTKTMNKKNTKDLIEDLLDPVFKDFNHEKINVKNAAKDLIRDLAKFVGPNILRGRIEMKGDLGQMSEYDKLSLI